MVGQEQVKSSVAESAFSRLSEFSSDPVGDAQEKARELRIEEMGRWAEGIGTHTERRAADHHEVSSQILTEVNEGGGIDVEDARRRLREVTQTRTGVRVKPNGDVKVHDDYPFYGDTRAKGWHTYRSPLNIRK